MLAAYLARQGVVELRDFDKPRPGPGDAVVKMHSASICGSDLHMIHDGFHDPELLGRPGYPGHEGTGVVVESRTDRFPVGTPVLTTPPGPAGGCFAELQCVGGNHLVALPEGTENEGSDMLRLLMAQQLGTTVYALKKFVTPERLAGLRSVAVIGAGSAGLFFVQQLRRLGIGEIFVSDLNAQRLQLASGLGASRTVLAGDESLAEVISDEWSADGVDLVIEAAGYDQCRAEAVEVVRERGAIGMFGFPESPGPAPFPVDLAFRKAITMEWFSGTQSEPGLESFHTALELIRTGEIEVDYCLQALYPLEQIAEALAVAREQGHGAAKICLEIG